MDTSNNHSDCGFGERLVSYIYDEAGPGERVAVESHLANCAACADELAAMSGVHFAISDWKKAEFDVIPTPAVSIPYAPAEVSRPQSQDATGTWLSALRNLFTLSPAWALTAASIAVFAIVGGVLIATFANRSGDKFEAQKNGKASPSPSAPAVFAAEPTPPPKVSPPSLVKPVPPVTATEPAKVATPRSAARPPVRANSAEQNRKTGVRPSKPAPNPDNGLTEEEEDDSLRLAEIFDEIGMR